MTNSKCHIERRKLIFCAPLIGILILFSQKGLCQTPDSIFTPPYVYDTNYKNAVIIRNEKLIQPYFQKYNALKALTFLNCEFQKNKSTIFNKNSDHRKYITIDSSNVEYFNLHKFSGYVFIQNSDIDSLFIDSSINSEVFIRNNKSLQFALIEKNKGLRAAFMQTEFNKESFVQIGNSTVNSFYFGSTGNTGINMIFFMDTLLEQIQLEPRSKTLSQVVSNSLPYNSFYFSGCYIDAKIITYNEIPNSIFRFDHCTFGPNARLDNFNCAQVSFNNCIINTPSLPVTFSSVNKYVLVSFDNTNVENFEMDFTPKMGLFFQPQSKRDDINIGYQKLLNKFKAEDKPDSYKYVDIQFQSYKNSAFEDFFARNWWYYGYRKYYVWRWTLGFLGLFYILNLLCWPQLKRIYPVITDFSPEKQSKKNLTSLAREGIVVLIFTFYVFFSISVRLDKLKFTKIRFVVLFFLEYMVGLWCLFFIFRTMLNF